MNWTATIKETNIELDKVTLVIEFTKGEDKVEYSFEFDHTPSEKELGILVHSRLVRLNSLATAAERLTVGLEIAPVDPEVEKQKAREKATQVEEERVEAEQEALVAKQAAENKAKQEVLDVKKKAQEELDRKHKEWLASQPKKCHVRTFILPDGTKHEYHSVCDKKDYTRADRPNNALGLLTGAYVRELLGVAKIKETVDSVHFLEKEK